MAQIAKNWSKIYRVHKYLPKGAYILTGGGGHLKFVKYTPVYMRGMLKSIYFFKHSKFHGFSATLTLVDFHKGKIGIK